jgi:uncharacterized membrane protein
MTLSFIFGFLQLLGGISFLGLALIQKRSGMTANFWAKLVGGILLLIMAAFNLKLLG